MALKYKESRRTDEFGNQFRYKAAVNPDPEDGESRDGRWAYDVSFAGGRHSSAALPLLQEGAMAQPKVLLTANGISGIEILGNENVPTATAMHLRQRAVDGILPYVVVVRNKNAFWARGW